MLRFLRRFLYGCRFTIAYAAYGNDFDKESEKRLPRMGSMHPERAEIYLGRLARGLANTLDEGDQFIVFIFGPEIHPLSSVSDHELVIEVLEKGLDAARAGKFTNLEAGD
jgi:hypothetical protein